MKTDLRVGEVMTRGVITLDASESAYEAAKTMKKNGIGCVVVVSKGKAVGIITEKDLVDEIVLAGKNAKKTEARQVMTRPLKTIGADAGIGEAAERLRELKIKRLPVVNAKGQLVGMITDDDLVRIYPGLLDVLLAEAEIGRFSKNEQFAGACEACGVYSEELLRKGKMLLCDECVEEEEG